MAHLRWPTCVVHGPPAPWSDENTATSLLLLSSFHPLCPPSSKRHIPSPPSTHWSLFHHMGDTGRNLHGDSALRRNPIPKASQPLFCQRRSSKCRKLVSHQPVGILCSGPGMWYLLSVVRFPCETVQGEPQKGWIRADGTRRPRDEPELGEARQAGHPRALGGTALCGGNIPACGACRAGSNPHPHQLARSLESQFSHL